MGDSLLLSLKFINMIAVNFYNYVGHPDTVNKQLGESTVITGMLRDNFNVIDPTITIRTSHKFDLNYCYIPEFKRYYFVSDVTMINSEKTEIRLKIDVLKSYETIILQASGTVTKSDTPDKYVSNRNSVYSRKPNFIKLDFPNKKLFNDEGTIIMITLKGTEV